MLNAQTKIIQEYINRRDITGLCMDVLEKAKKVGLKPELTDALDTLNNVRDVLIRKSLELDLLEILALESDNENIIELREQLFTTVRLIHGDIINKTLEEYAKHEQCEKSTPLGIFEGHDENITNKRSLVSRIKEAMYQRKTFRLKKKEIKAHMLATKNDAYDDCASSV